ncbi:MAG: YHS domain-containing protein [Planctomycetota bacterium]
MFRIRHLVIAAVAVTMVAGLATAGTTSPAELASAAQAAGTANGLCPVLNKPVTPQAGTVPYRGEKIGFCCPGCVAKFKADPVRFMDEMRLDPATYGYTSKGPTLASMQKAAKAVGSANGLCPVMGRKVSPTGGAVTYKGQKVAFCCKGCLGKFQKDPERYMRMMRADPLAFAYDRPGPTNDELRKAREAVKSANGLCPVLNKLVAAKGGALTAQGQRIAFCCPGCVAKFKADPQPYMAKMQAEPAVYGYVPARR